MCGRYLIEGELDELYRKYILYESEAQEIVHGEVRPTDAAPVIIDRQGKNKLVVMRWGLSGYQASQRLINARSETLMQKMRFSKLMEGYRCIVPATAFFEWQKIGSKKVKRTLHGSGILSFAALYEPNPAVNTFTIITMPASGEIASIHDRMPVALADEDVETWLRPDISASLAYQKLLEQKPKYFLEHDPTNKTQLTFF